MTEYTVQKPFLCFEGQFEEGKRSLCIGIEIKALQNAGKFRVYLGKNKNTYYDITYEKALHVQTTQDKFYKAHSGRDTFILPLTAFDVGFHTPPTEEKKTETMKRLTLF